MAAKSGHIDFISSHVSLYLSDQKTFELSLSNHLNENAETSTQHSGKVVVPRSLDQRQGHTGKIIIHTILCS